MTDRELGRAVAQMVMKWQLSTNSPHCDCGDVWIRQFYDHPKDNRRTRADEYDPANDPAAVFGPGGVLEVMRSKDEGTKSRFAVLLHQEVASRLGRWDNILIWPIHITARDVCVAAVKTMEKEAQA